MIYYVRVLFNFAVRWRTALTTMAGVWVVKCGSESKVRVQWELVVIVKHLVFRAQIASKNRYICSIFIRVTYLVYILTLKAPHLQLEPVLEVVL